MLIGCKDIHEASREAMEKMMDRARYPIISCCMTCKGISPSGYIYVPSIRPTGAWYEDERGEEVREALGAAASGIFRHSEALRSLADDISSHAYMPPAALRDHLLRSWKSGGIEILDKGPWPVKNVLIDYKKYFRDLYLTGEAYPSTNGRASTRAYDTHIEDDILHSAAEEIIKAASPIIPDKDIVMCLREYIHYHSISISFHHNSWHGKGRRMNYAVMDIDFVGGSPEFPGNSFWDTPLPDRSNVVHISAQYILRADKFLEEEI